MKTTELLNIIQKKAVEAIQEEIREPRWGGRTKFIEFQPIATFNGIDIDVYQDEHGEVNIRLYDTINDEEYQDEAIEKAVYDTLPDWDLVRCDMETDGISRYDGLDPAFASWDDVNNYLYR